MALLLGLSLPGLVAAQAVAAANRVSRAAMVKDRGLSFDHYNGTPQGLTNVNGTVFFSAQDVLPLTLPPNPPSPFVVHGTELWKSDGTAAGTLMVKDINATQVGHSIHSGTWVVTGDSNPRCLTSYNGTLLFAADDGFHGYQLWRSDGTEAGTQMVKLINPIGGAWNPGSACSLASLNGSVFFSADDGVHGFELWKTDGTAAGTTMVSDIFPGKASSSPQGFTAAGDSLFFSADDGIHGFELWKTDGTQGGTRLVKDIDPGSGGKGVSVGSSFPDELTAVGAEVFFMVKSSASGKPGLWKSDGTAAGTRQVKELLPGGTNLTAVGGTLFFSAFDLQHGQELWRSDGTDAGTFMVKAIYPGAAGSNPGSFRAFDDALYFAATDAAHGRELWRSDGTAAGTLMVKDLIPGTLGSDPHDLTVVNGHLVFVAAWYFGGGQVWISDGTERGTRSAGDVDPGTGSHDPADITDVNSTAFFSASNPSAGRELWKVPVPVAPTRSGSGGGKLGDGVTGISSDPFTNPTSWHETAVSPAIFASGQVQVSAFQVGRFVDGGASDIGFATSHDDGAHWTSGVLPGLTKFAPAGTASTGDRVTDPAVAFDARHGVWLISSIPLTDALASNLPAVGVVVSRSTDAGATWRQPVPIAQGAGLEQQSIVCDNAGTSPHFGNCYAQFDDNAQGQLILMSTSVDGGMTWSAPSPTANQAHGIFGQPVIRPDGSVVVPIEEPFDAVICRHTYCANLLAFTSNDGGTTWGPAVRIGGMESAYVHGGLRVPPVLSAQSDKAGRLYLVWADCTSDSRCADSNQAQDAVNAIVMATSDDGVNWTEPSRIPIDSVASGVDHFIPSLAIDPTSAGKSARIALTYYFYPTNQCTAYTCQLNVGLASSTTGGATWSPAATQAGPISLLSLPPTTGGFMAGDRTATSFGTDGRAHSFFAVGRRQRNDSFEGQKIVTRASVLPTSPPPPPPPPNIPTVNTILVQPPIGPAPPPPAPNFSPLEGGGTARVSGTGFKTCSPLVPFTVSFVQRSPAPNPVTLTGAPVTVFSDKVLTVPIPASPVAGNFDVRVTTPCGISPVSAGAPGPPPTTGSLLIYYAGPPPPPPGGGPAPTVTGISPSSGPPSGGTRVTVTGTGFLSCSPPGLSVIFGPPPFAPMATQVTVLSDTTLSAVSPAGSGSVNIVVGDACGSTAPTPATLFTYM